MNLNYKRLPLEFWDNNFKPRNVRDIGGYPADGGGITKWKTFVRAEGLESITEQDAAFLYEYGIRTVIDLRFCSEFEKNNTEYLFNIYTKNKIMLVNMPLIDNYDETRNLYIHILESGKKNIRQVFEYIGERLAYGGIIYNCFAGKDRTGVLSALLLLLCGVSELDVLADYMISSVYLRSLAKKLSLPNNALSSDPELMDEFLIYLKKKYQSTEQYILSIGISNQIIAYVKDKFIQI
ncbi:MAG: tyrosine-protein phosphatase [Eubacteriales bacterium]|nr:tyrosine-protein phosphatase [Eubacteriales bacterium]